MVLLKGKNVIIINLQFIGIPLLQWIVKLFHLVFSISLVVFPLNEIFCVHCNYWICKDPESS